LADVAAVTAATVAAAAAAALVHSPLGIAVVVCDDSIIIAIERVVLIGRVRASICRNIFSQAIKTGKFQFCVR
jgi:hypothetical protein